MKGAHIPGERAEGHFEKRHLSSPSSPIFLVSMESSQLLGTNFFLEFFIEKKKPTIPSFLSKPTIYLKKVMIMEKMYKRTTREVPQHVREKISAALTGRKKSEAQCRKISNGLKKAWSRIPKQDTGISGITINDLI